MSDVITIFSIGVKFGHLSGGKLSSYYKEKEYTPVSDSELQKMVDDGLQIHIRPADKTEMNWAYANLGKIIYNKNS